MEVEGASNHKLMVCAYEFLGTAFLAYAVLVSGGKDVAVAFTVFVIILVIGPITGAHMNPAVTIGVYVSRIKYGQDALFFLLIMVAQCLGGFFGMLWAYGSLYTSDLGTGGKIYPAWVPALCPVGVDDLELGFACAVNKSRSFQTFFTQMICTFLFVLEILVLKEAKTAPTKDGMLGALAVGFGLYAIINLDHLVGPCFNPAIGFVQTTYQVMNLKDLYGDYSDALTEYLWAYTIGPAVGGLLAGLAQMFHRNNVDKVAQHQRDIDEQKSLRF